MNRSLHATAAAVAVPMLSSASIAFAQTAPAATAQAATAQAATPSAGPSPVFGMMQGVFGLLVVLGLIFAAAWLMKRLAPRGRASGAVQVIGGASVGPREKVVVVRFGTRTLLLGVAPGHVGLLHAADPADLVETPGPDASTDTPPTFGERLRAARGRA